MTTINSIPESEWNRLHAYREECREIGSCTDPADWETAEKSISYFFREMKWNDPITFRHVASPSEAQKIFQNEYNQTDYVDTQFWGSIEIYWIGYLKFMSEIPGIETDDEKMKMLQVWLDLAKSCFWWWIVDKQNVIICDRPASINWDENNFLHNDDGMSVSFRDGTGIYSYHGYRIPNSRSYIIDNPEAITIKEIEKETNIEMRRILVEKMGIEKYIHGNDFNVVDMDMIRVDDITDDYMPRALIKSNHKHQYLVGTDGSTKSVYYMNVDPEAKTCREAHMSISPIDEDLIIGNS